MVFYVLIGKCEKRKEDVEKMFDMSFAQGTKMVLTFLVIFAVVGGIVSQTTQGASGRGFMEGMWKGVEIYFLVLVGIGVIFLVMLGMGMVSTAVNTSI
ncbi:MAG: hypothetical protein NTY09_14590 [bacterium]|nr:hypothetical protein [bacterium]